MSYNSDVSQLECGHPGHVLRGLKGLAGDHTQCSLLLRLGSVASIARLSSLLLTRCLGVSVPCFFFFYFYAALIVAIMLRPVPTIFSSFMRDRTKVSQSFSERATKFQHQS